MSFGLEVSDLSVRYGRTVALDGVSFSLPPATVLGLLGRNGSGKTTLLSVLAAFRRASTGTVRVDGEDPFENARVMGGTCLIRESGDVIDDSARDVLRFVARARPLWDADLAERLVDRFEIPLRKKPGQLSRGKRSALGVVIGLASRAPLTMFDEAYLGLDAPSRYLFYDELLADYTAHPRTIVLSSHLIEEVDRLFERVLILDRGRVLVDDDADDLRSRGLSVTGPAEAVDAFTAHRTVLGRRTLGRTVEATVLDEPTRTAPVDLAVGGPAGSPPGGPAGEHGPAADADRHARELGLDLGPVPLQDLFVHLTRGSQE
jgi:ABC-2 type transport system ATP-binding protein